MPLAVGGAARWHMQLAYHGIMGELGQAHHIHESVQESLFHLRAAKDELRAIQQHYQNAGIMLPEPSVS